MVFGSLDFFFLSVHSKYEQRSQLYMEFFSFAHNNCVYVWMELCCESIVPWITTTYAAALSIGMYWMAETTANAEFRTNEDCNQIPAQ